MLRILDTGVAPAEENMSLDAKLLQCLDPSGLPIFHRYRWQGPSISYGYFIRPEEHFDLNALEGEGIALARRPTGGGIVFHLWDLAFSFLMPVDHPAFASHTLDNYRFVNGVVLEGVEEMFHAADLAQKDFPSRGPSCGSFCMARPTRYDVVFRGKKIAGAAQRRTQRGYLHQGTISLLPPDERLLASVLRCKDEVASAMKAYAFVPPMLTQEPLETLRERIEEKLVEKFMEKLTSI